MLLEGKIAASTYSPAAGAEASPEVVYKKLDDKLLWTNFKKGDESAFISIYKNYVNQLFSYGCQFCADREMVKDCLQDFFLYLRKNREGFGNTDAIKLYLFKAFRRRIIDYMKKYGRECHWQEEMAFTRFAAELSSESIYIQRQIEAEQLEKLNKALQVLDSREREAIYYFYYEGLGYAQIADVFGFSHVSSARRLIYRALSQLRKFLH